MQAEKGMGADDDASAAAEVYGHSPNGAGSNGKHSPLPPRSFSQHLGVGSAVQRQSEEDFSEIELAMSLATEPGTQGLGPAPSMPQSSESIS
eukprot:2132943-Rhodomonas_salina.2